MSMRTKMKIILDEETKDKKKYAKEVEVKKKKIKELEGKDKDREQLKQKLEKMTTLRDQMTAAVQTLKQKNEVLIAQKETHHATIKSQEHTLQSYLEIIKNNDSKIKAKDNLIDDLKDQLKKKDIGIETHREIAYRLMDQSDSETEDESNKEKTKKDLERLYQTLREEEEKVKKSDQEIILLKSQVEDMGMKLGEAENSAKDVQEKLQCQLTEKEKENETIQKDAKKEVKQLKELLKTSDESINEFKQEVKQLKEQLAGKRMNDELRKTLEVRTESIATQIYESEICASNIIEALPKQVEPLTLSISQMQAKDQMSIEKLNAIIQEKQTLIDELKESSVFVDQNLKDSENEINSLKSHVNDIKKQLQSTQQKLDIEIKKCQDLEDSRQNYVNKISSSKQEISQLLYLNNQLKSNVQQMEITAKEGCAKCKVGKIAVPEEVSKSANSNPHSTGHRKQNVTDIMFADVHTLCYSEVKESGSCFNRNSCNFSHDIPEEIKQNKDRVLNIIGQKRLCINEYNKQGSCDLKERCRFHHEVSDEQRKNTAIQEIMKQKQSRMHQPKDQSKHEKPVPICVFEYHAEEQCPWGIGCRFNHNITQLQRNDVKLKEIMKNKMNRMRGLKDQRQRERQANPADSIRIPKQIIEKMRQFLASVPGADRETLMMNGEEAGAMVASKEVIQKIYEMLPEHPEPLPNHF